MKTWSAEIADDVVTLNDVSDQVASGRLAELAELRSIKSAGDMEPMRRFKNWQLNFQPPSNLN